MMILSLILAATQAPQSAQEYQQQYAKCVVDFSARLIPSGEPAELLVRAGEAECIGLFSKVRASRALEDLELTKEGSDLTVEDAEEIKAAFVEGFKKAVHEQALKNVLVIKTEQAVKSENDASN